MQLQRHLPEIEAAGIALFTITYDPQEALADFAREYGISYPLLSDPGSEVIQRYGILNTLIRPDEPVYGIPYPGSYLTDAAGVVVEKIFHQRYQVRDAVESVLHRSLGLALDPAHYPSAHDESEGVRVTAVLGADELVFQRRALLFVRLDIDEGLHVYGPSVPDGYFGTTVTVTGPEGLVVEAAQYPPSHTLRIEELAEDFEVFDGQVEIVVPLIASVREGDAVTLDVALQYQACDDHQCFLPQRKTLRMDVPLSQLNRPPRRT